MIYLDYVKYKASFEMLQERFNEILTEKERLFTKTQPNAIRYDKEQIQCSVDGNILEDYVISMDEKRIDEQLNRLRIILLDREKLLEIKEKELRKSHCSDDRVYLLRYIDGLSINKIATAMCYSKRQVYRVLNKIDKKISVMECIS